MHLRFMPCMVSKSKQFCVVQSFLVARTGGSSLCLGISRCSWHRGPCVFLIDNTHIILEATARDVPQHVQMFFWCGMNCKQMQDEATFWSRSWQSQIVWNIASSWRGLNVKKMSQTILKRPEMLDKSLHLHSFKVSFNIERLYTGGTEIRTKTVVHRGL